MALSQREPSSGTILLVHADATLRGRMAAALTMSGYVVHVAGDGRHALELARNVWPDVILADELLPDMEASTLCRRLHEDPATRHIPRGLIARGPSPTQEPPPVALLLRRPPGPTELLGGVEHLLEQGRALRHLIPVSEANAVLVEALGGTDPTTHHHSLRMASLATLLGQRLNLSPTEVQWLGTAARLHDIGKAWVSPDIIAKPGPLTQEEFEQVKHHAEVGGELSLRLGNAPWVVEGIRHHHEHWNGQGYPDGLNGEAIPLSGRVLAVVDTYDALTSHRPYRSLLTPTEATDVLLSEAGTKLDPRLAAVFVDLVRQPCP